MMMGDDRTPAEPTAWHCPARLSRGWLVSLIEREREREMCGLESGQRRDEEWVARLGREKSVFLLEMLAALSRVVSV